MHFIVARIFVLSLIRCRSLLHYTTNRKKIDRRTRGKNTPIYDVLCFSFIVRRRLAAILNIIAATAQVSIDINRFAFSRGDATRMYFITIVIVITRFLVRSNCVGNIRIYIYVGRNTSVFAYERYSIVNIIRKSRITVDFHGRLVPKACRKERGESEVRKRQTRFEEMSAFLYSSCMISFPTRNKENTAFDLVFVVSRTSFNALTTLLLSNLSQTISPH